MQSIISRSAFVCALAISLTAAQAQPAESALTPQQGDLLTIAPFTLRTHCEVVEQNIQSILNGQVAGFEHVYRGELRSLKYTCKDGVIKPTNRMSSVGTGGRPFSFYLRHRPDTDSLKDADRNYDSHEVHFNESGLATKIEMARSWKEAEDGPRRNEILDSLIKRYGPPNAVNYVTNDREGPFEMVWGTSLVARSPNGKVKTNVSGRAYAKTKPIDCMTLQEPPRIARCVVDQMEAFREPFWAVLQQETDVRVHAQVVTYKGSSKVSSFRLIATDVPAQSVIDKEKAEESRLSSERYKESERLRRERSQPKF